MKMNVWRWLCCFITFSRESPLILWMASRSLLLPLLGPPFGRRPLLPRLIRAAGRRRRSTTGTTAASSTTSHPLDKIRNVGIIAHIDAGKTTTTERILFLTGSTSHVGEVDSGDTVMDFLPQERERGITIQSAATSLEWCDMRINVIDTPGHVDFSVEVERAVRVLDGAVIVLDAVAGVQAQTETVWRQAQKYGVPAVAFVNKMDRDGADFQRALTSINKRLGVKAVAIQMPVQQAEEEGGVLLSGGGASSSFDSVVDLLTMEVLRWQPAEEDRGVLSTKRQHMVLHRRPLSKEVDGGSAAVAGGGVLWERAVRARGSLVEALAERDEELMEAYLQAMDKEEEEEEEGGGGGSSSIPLQDLLSALRRLCVRGEVLPTVCGASLKGKGVEPLLDSVVAFLPSPLDRPKPVARRQQHHQEGSSSSSSSSSSMTKSKKGSSSHSVEIEPTDKNNLCAYAFKVTHDRQRGLLVFVRVYSGVLHAKDMLYNSTRDQKERPLQLLEVRADDMTVVESVGAGHTVAVVGLKGVYTGDTLVAYKGPLHGAVLDQLSVPSPVFSLAVEPQSSAKQQALEDALQALSREDPSLRVETDPESGQIMLRGLGELHLEIVCDKLKRSYGVEVETGQAHVAYREGIMGGGSGGVKDVHVTYDRQVGGRRMYAGVTVSLMPASEAHKVPAVSMTDEATKVLNVEERASLISGFEDACTRGPTSGYPVSGLDVVIEGVQRDQDTSPGSLRACAVLALREAMREAGTVVLEPVMKVEVLAPDASVGNVLSDLTVARRGAVRDLDEEGQQAVANSKHVIHAHVPLSRLLGYATALRSITQGEGSFSMEFSHYSEAQQ